MRPRSVARGGRRDPRRTGRDEPGPERGSGHAGRWDHRRRLCARRAGVGASVRFGRRPGNDRGDSEANLRAVLQYQRRRRKHGARVDRGAVCRRAVVWTVRGPLGPGSGNPVRRVPACGGGGRGRGQPRADAHPTRVSGAEVSGSAARERETVQDPAATKLHTANEPVPAATTAGLPQSLDRGMRRVRRASSRTCAAPVPVDCRAQRSRSRGSRRGAVGVEGPRGPGGGLPVTRPGCRSCRRSSGRSTGPGGRAARTDCAPSPDRIAGIPSRPHGCRGPERRCGLARPDRRPG